MNSSISFVGQFVTRDLVASIILVVLAIVAPLLHKGLKCGIGIRAAYSILVLCIGAAVPTPWSGIGMFLVSLAFLAFGFFKKQKGTFELGIILAIAAAIYAFVPGYLPS